MSLEPGTPAAETRVVVAGNIDAEGQKKLSAFLRELAGRPGLGKVSLDLRAVGSTTSGGIGTLMNFYKALRSRGGSLEVRGISETLREQFAEIHIDRIFPVRGE